MKKERRTYSRNSIGVWFRVFRTIRESRNLSAAAARLGMAPVSLSRWIGRRKLPMHVEP